VVFSKAPLKDAVVIKATTAAANCPVPCMEKTAAIMAPRHLVGANLDTVSMLEFYKVVVTGGVTQTLGNGPPLNIALSTSRMNSNTYSDVMTAERG
jgi:hypothetical protein